MNWLDRAALAVSPSYGLSRLRARAAASVVMHYDAGAGGRRSKSWRATSADADAAGVRRTRIGHVAHDMVRNAPFAARAVQCISSNTVGDGIIPAISGVSDAAKTRFQEVVAFHFDTTSIDAGGQQNLYGLQRLVMNSVVASGEAIIRIRRRRSTDNLPLPFQLEVLEPDYIDTAMSFARSQGATIRDGIEYDAIGRRTAYWLYDEHPGAKGYGLSFTSRRVPASEILHVFRQDRPGQQRGVSWLAPVARPLQDLRDYYDAQVMRQKIAACFAAFRITSDMSDAATAVSVPELLQPGGVHTLGPGEDVKFANPAAVDGLDAFTTAMLREIAAGLGVTYEALVGDLSSVNFTSGRMGRMEMDRNVSAWQWLMLVPQMMERLGALTLEYMAAMEGPRALRNARIDWTPPARIVVDPTREYPAIRDKIRAGLSSWQKEVRALGYDPESIAREMREDAATFDAMGFAPESDPRRASNGAAGQQPMTDAPA